MLKKNVMVKVWLYTKETFIKLKQNENIYKPPTRVVFYRIILYTGI